MKKKYKIGYTTGVYDMFHIGHLNILRRAKEQCEMLIVGVTTDELCYKRKQKYPIINEQERMAIVEAIRYVDKGSTSGRYGEDSSCEGTRSRCCLRRF